MIVVLGSQNPTKLEALREQCGEYPYFASADIVGIETETGVSEQPKTLEETIRGARNRARKAFARGDFGVGIESGLMEVPLVETGVMDVAACAFYDGNEYFVGLSSAWECPPEVIAETKKGANLTEACVRAGYTNNPNLGQEKGVIAIFSGERITRKKYNEQAILTALIRMGARYPLF